MYAHLSEIEQIARQSIAERTRRAAEPNRTTYRRPRRGRRGGDRVRESDTV